MRLAKAGQSGRRFAHGQTVRMAADGVRQFLFQQKHVVKPRLVAIFHGQPESRRLSGKLIQRLNELGENPCVLTDDPECIPIEGLRYHLMPGGGRQSVEEEIIRQVSAWSDSPRVIADMIAGTSAGAMTGTLYASGMDADFSTSPV